LCTVPSPGLSLQRDWPQAGRERASSGAFNGMRVGAHNPRRTVDRTPGRPGCQVCQGRHAEAPPCSSEGNGGVEHGGAGRPGAPADLGRWPVGFAENGRPGESNARHHVRWFCQALGAAAGVMPDSTEQGRWGGRPRLEGSASAGRVPDRDAPGARWSRTEVSEDRPEVGTLHASSRRGTVVPLDGAGRGVPPVRCRPGARCPGRRLSGRASRPALPLSGFESGTGIRGFTAVPSCPGDRKTARRSIDHVAER
jgi:hypothetical protein